MAKLYSLTYNDILEKRKEWLYQDIGYINLPKWAKSYISGYEQCLHDETYKQDVIFSYVIDGKRLAVNSQEYKEKVNYQTLDTNTGAHIWRHSEKLFSSLPEKIETIKE